MILSAQYIESTCVLIHKWSGDVTCDEIIDVHLEIIHLASIGTPIKGLLVDYTEVTKIDVSASEARKIAASRINLSRMLPNMLFSVVAPRPSIFGTYRMLEGYSTELTWTNNISKSLSEAEEWLCKQLHVESIYG